MDNVTHSLVGLATARIINAKVNKDKDPKISLFIHFVSIFAANFPDLDLLFALIDPGIIGYLSHHRGHTHTFFYLIPQALLLWGLTVYFFKVTSGKIRLWGFLAIAINMILHIALDFQNSYGVHPFSPFNNKWYYRDTLFIIEPLIWFSLLPVILTPIPDFIKAFKSKDLKQNAKNMVWFGFVALFVSLVVMAYRAHAIEAVSMFLCLSLFLALLLVYRRHSESVKAGVSLVLVIAIISIFSIAKHKALKQIQLIFAKTNYDQKLLDVVLTPMPANPQCWRFIIVSTDQVKSYFLRTGAYENNALGFWDCPKGIYQSQSDLYEDHRRKHALNPVYVETTYSSSMNALVEDLGKENNCKRDQWLQFVRTPLKESLYIYEDIRFKRNSEKSFSRLDISDPKVKCLNLEVPWIPPRQDLIEMAKKQKSYGK